MIAAQALFSDPLHFLPDGIACQQTHLRVQITSIKGPNEAPHELDRTSGRRLVRHRHASISRARDHRFAKLSEGPRYSRADDRNGRGTSVAADALDASALREYR